MVYYFIGQNQKFEGEMNIRLPYFRSLEISMIIDPKFPMSGELSEPNFTTCAVYLMYTYTHEVNFVIRLYRYCCYFVFISYSLKWQYN